MSDNYIDAIRNEFKLLDHWVYLNAADQMIPGNYWLSAARDFYNFVEYGRMEDIPNADIATHPFLLAAWNESIERSACGVRIPVFGRDFREHQSHSNRQRCHNSATVRTLSNVT